MAYIDEKGREILDPTPLEIPVGFRHPPSLEERIMRSVRYEVSQMASKNGQETFEEADDFDVGDDFDPHSPYEEHFDHSVNLQGLKDKVEENRKRKRGSNGTLTEETPLGNGTYKTDSGKETVKKGADAPTQ